MGLKECDRVTKSSLVQNLGLYARCLLPVFAVFIAESDFGMQQGGVRLVVICCLSGPHRRQRRLPQV